MMRVEIEKILVVHAHVRDGKGLPAVVYCQELAFVTLRACTGNPTKKLKALPNTTNLKKYWAVCLAAQDTF